MALQVDIAGGIYSATFQASVINPVEKPVDVEKNPELVVSPPPQPTEAYPEGGAQAWMTLFGAFLMQFVTFGYVNSFGAYQAFYVHEYLDNYTPSEIGWIGGVQILFTFSAGILVGRAFDRGYFYYLMFASAACNIVGLVLLSVSHKNSFYQVFLTNGVLVGLSAGLAYIPTLSIPTQYFQRRRAFAIGIVSSGCALGAVVHPIILNIFFNGSIGFHNGVRISAGVNLLLSIVALCLMRTRLPPKEIKKFPIAKWLKEPQYLAMVFSASFIFLGLFYPIFYLQLEAVSHGVDPKFAHFSLSVLNAGSMVGRILPGFLAPWIGVFNLLVFAGVFSGIVAFCMAYVKSVAGTVIFALAYGALSGASIALVPAVVGQISSHISEVGTRMGVMFIVSGFVGLCATPLAGALLTNNYIWLRADVFSGVTLICSGICFATARHYVSKQRGTQIL